MASCGWSTRTVYEPVREGQWVTVRHRQQQQLACCDCGLVHDTEFRIRAGKIEFRMFRNARATGQIRRHWTRGIHEG